MVTYRKPKKIRKVIEIGNNPLAAGTDATHTIHTVTDPGTTKRIIVTVDAQEDSYTAADVYAVGICITRAGETLPTVANVESEEYRWVWFEYHNASEKGDAIRIHRDMKIQRKVKDGDIISIVKNQTAAGDSAHSVTLFIDET